ncbi:MAG: hypothetical protein E7140_00735 [Rikenellaceae bacterium]|nr:hypothetical protein [Rikenellaceae bacterium]
MKKLQKLFMAVAAVAGVTACTTDATEDLGVNLNEGPKTLTLSLDDTRTQLGEKADGTYPLTWAENDAISVNGSVSNPLTADEAGAASATFTFNNGFGSAPYFVAYPATSTNNQVVFAAEQTHTSNTTFGNGATVMYGYANDLSSVKLNHLTGVLKIGVVSGTEGPAFIKEVRISTVDRKPIAGTFSVDAEGKLTPVKTADVITYKSESDAGFLVLPVAENNPVTYIHVAVPAGVYGELYVTLESADGVMYKTVKTDSTKPVNAGAVREFSSNIAFVPVAETETFVIADYSDLYEFKEAVEGGSTLNAIFVNDVEMPVVGDVNYPAWEPINAPSYTGTITGNGYAIKGLYAPLFNVTAASFKGLHLVMNVEEKVNPIFGAFARQLVANGNAPKVEHCSVNGSITINTNIAPAKADVLEDGATGGFVGIAKGVHFEDCVNNAAIELKRYSSTVKMWSNMGGLVGLAGMADDQSTSFTNCTNNGALTHNDTTGKTAADLGGIVGTYTGKKATVTFDNCSNYGNLTIADTAKTRDCNIGGIISIIDGAKDASDKDNKKSVTFKNNTIIGGNIYANGEVVNALRLGGIIGSNYSFSTVVIDGPVTKSGLITVTNKVTGAAYIGGLLGHQGNGCTFNINDFVTITKEADIAVSAELSSNCYCAGCIGISSRPDGGSNPAVRIQYKTVTNNADLTFSGTCGGILRFAGFVGYSYNTNGYVNHTGKFVNNGKIEVTESAEIASTMELAGLSGYVNGYNFSAGTNHTGQIVNNGDIYFKGTAKGDMAIGGVMARHWTNATTLELINTGNIYVTGKFDTSKTIRVGGVVARISTDKAISKAQCHCDIVAYHVEEDGTVTPFPYVGMISGAPDDVVGTISSSKMGGRIATTATVENGVVTPTWTEMTATNYFDYVVGLRANLTAYEGVSYLTSEDEIVYGSFGNKAK